MFTKKTIGALAVIFVAVMLIAAALPAAELSQEIAARALLGEAEKLNEVARPSDALPLLDRIKAEYPGTEAASYAELRRAECRFYLQDYVNAIATAQQVIAANPGTVLAAWAQCVLGESLALSGRTNEAVAQLLKVDDMLPNQNDLGPLNKARSLIARLCNDFLVGDAANTDAIAFLGLDQSNPRHKTRVLAILAAGWGKTGRIDQANTILARIARECPEEQAELGWARTRVAQGYLRSVGSKGDFSAAAAVELENALMSLTAGKCQRADAVLALSRHYRRNNDKDSAIALLQSVKDELADTARGPELWYELGQALYSANRTGEAVAMLQRVADEAPTSGYAAPALYLIGHRDDVERNVAVDALTTLVDGNYDIRWRGLALRRLGGLFRDADPARAAAYYTQAIDTFRQCLAEQKADVRSDWQAKLEARIAVIQAELESLD